MKADVVVVGGAGHVGFPLAVVIANAGMNVYGLDVNETSCKLLNQGRVIYKEDDAEEELQKALDSKRIEFGTDVTKIKEAGYVIIIIGTPLVDGKASTKDLESFVTDTLIPNMKDNQAIILRSTVIPGTTERIRGIIEDLTERVEGVNFFLVFAPE